jgi:signal peptidase I
LLLKKDAPLLKEFVRHEKEKQDSSTQARPYIAFIDRGAPVKEDGSIDQAKVLRLGLKVPEGHVLGLGDNYAMSADSRDFGFIPIRNLRGSPSFNFWPVSERLGPLPQPSSPWLTLPNLLIWSLVAIISFLSWLYYHNKHKRSVFKNK